MKQEKEKVNGLSPEKAATQEQTIWS
ncbi:hypothetical protein RDI58_019270 [Solanum bulbocastanum]|uniref:Uncharacterized protein n=1 Tax=Solanum bulbocastanum TaxID=147425 RepID=A0AAN8T7X6_SOLBU